ncbi:CBS domain-containing protein [Niallia oryzisoli]|uniref:CBS domain-containing protein n=1 Tax=Niallia oryzisoli TaxID=1737571 RepID=UPI003734F085
MVNELRTNILSERFEVSFNRIHAALIRMVDSRTDRFTQLVRSGTRSFSLIRTYEDDLYQFAKLRNAMVHDKREIGYYIAEPHEDIVNQIEQIAYFFDQPFYALKIASKPVHFSDKTTLKEVVQGIKEYSYSQFPIYQEGECIGLLRAGSILEWIANNLVQNSINLGNVTVKEILLHENNHPIVFAPKSMNIFEIEDIYERAHQEKRDIEMVIITENGNSSEKPLGIVTAWDLIEIDYTAD